MTRVAAFDCGTNSLRLLIADIKHGRLHDIVRSLEIVRLGQGVDRTGRFDDDALARTLAVTRQYAELCRKHRVERMRFVATSATRDAANRDVFIDSVREILGVEPEVIDGDEEARLSFRGALSAIPDAAAKRSGRLVADIGGGSTELVLGETVPEAAHSMDVGSVRLTERNIRSDPPTAEELAAVRREVEQALDHAASIVDLGAAREVIGVAGTITTVTAHAMELSDYDSAAINGSRLRLDDVLEACRSLASMPREERLMLPYLHPGRVDVIAAGATIWSTVLQRVAAETKAAGSPLHWVVTSEHDILDGAALSLAD